MEFHRYFFTLLILIFHSNCEKQNENFIRCKKFICDFKNEFEDFFYANWSCSCKNNRKNSGMNFYVKLKKEVKKLFVSLQFLF